MFWQDIKWKKILKSVGLWVGLLGLQFLEKIHLEIFPIFRSSGNERQFIWIINYWETDLIFPNTIVIYYLYFGISSNWFGITSLRNFNFHQKFNFFIFKFSSHFPCITEKTESNWTFKKRFFHENLSKLCTSCCHFTTPFSPNICLN